MIWFKKNTLLILSACVGLVLFWVLSYAPMLAGDDPEATKHVVDRKSAETAALQFVRQRLNPEGELDAFAMYAVDRDVFGYLYKNKEIESVIDQFRDTLPLETYRVEVKEADTGVTHLVDVNPYTGEPVEWSLWIAGNEVAADKLEQIGQQTIERLGLAGIAPKLVSADESAGELVYELKHTSFHEATAQLTILADDLGAATVTVHWDTPADYLALVEKQDGWASLLGSVGLLVSGSLQLAAMIYALANLKLVRLSRGIVMALVFGTFYCAINVNMYPGLKATVLGILDGGNYSPMQGGDAGGTIAGMLGMLIIANAMTLFLAIGLYFSAVAGDSLQRRSGWNLWPAWQESHYGTHLSSAVWKGYLFAPAMLGMQSVIYIGAESGLRTWYTIDAMTSSNNMVFPLLLPILAWCAALSEEIVYRLFAIPALKKLFRFTFPAVLVSSMVWALGHVQYPIYPFYTRFVEVTLIGLLFAYIFLKHGILTAIFTHAIVDIIWMGIAITSNTPAATDWTAFAVYLSVPALIGLAVQWRHLNRRRRPTAA
jgi:hypothetical protein